MCSIAAEEAKEKTLSMTRMLEGCLDQLCDEAEKTDDIIKQKLNAIQDEVVSVEEALIERTRVLRGKSAKQLVIMEQNYLAVRKNESIANQISFQIQPLRISQAALNYAVLRRTKSVLDNSGTKQIPTAMPLFYLKTMQYSSSMKDSILLNSIQCGFFPIIEKDPLPATIISSTKTVSSPLSFSNPHGISISPKTGHLYVADQSNHRVQIVSPSLNLIGIIDGKKSPLKNFSNLSGVSVCPATGNIVTVEYDINRVQMYNSSLDYIMTVSNSGSIESDFQGPVNTTHDMSGNFYVSDSKNNKVKKFLPDGSPCCVWADKPTTRVNKPFSLAVNDENHIMVTTEAGNEVFVFSDMGDLVKTIVVIQTSYNSICRGPRGGFLLGDYTNNKAHFYDQKGNKYHELLVDKPLGLTFGITGDLFVVNHTPGALLLCG